MDTATKERSPALQFEDFLGKRKDQLAKALGSRIGPDRMIRLALTAFSNSEDLQVCTPSSIYNSIMVASQLGLEIGVGGQGYLIPYKGVCTFVPGWRGIVDIVGRGGRSIVWTGAVYEGDEFEHKLGSNPVINHVRARNGAKGDREIIATYAVAEVAGHSRPIMEMLWREELDEHFKRFNKVGNRHYRFKHEEMYFRKVPLLQVCKYLPQTQELSNVLEASYAAESGEAVILDEQGNVLRTPGESGGPDGVVTDPREPELKEPQRRTASHQAQDVEPKRETRAAASSGAAQTPTKGSNEPATEGEKAYIKRKAGERLDELCSHLGITFGTLSKAGFSQLKAELA